MVLSGCLMLSQSIASLKWPKDQFSLEFTYDEGFEFEQKTPQK